MRMRKKKHLEERLLEVRDKLFTSDIADRNFNSSILEKEYLDFDKIFGRKAPLYLEIGCGKGGFATKFAEQNPDINLIAVEKNANVIVGACEEAARRNIKNLYFIKVGAEYLQKYIPENSIERIFLNFSCPFPKSKYASHRLTHRNFLAIYKKLLKKYGEIHQKTDNVHFFEFSIEEFTQSGFALKNVSLDLHNSKFEGNIETEYEHRFASLGQPIHRLEAYIPERNV